MPIFSPPGGAKIRRISRPQEHSIFGEGLSSGQSIQLETGVSVPADTAINSMISA